MSFFGGGTDVESFFREHGGAVLSTTFDKYCYVNVRHLPRFFDYSTTVESTISRTRYGQGQIVYEITVLNNTKLTYSYRDIYFQTNLEDYGGNNYVVNASTNDKNKT